MCLVVVGLPCLCQDFHTKAGSKPGPRNPSNAANPAAGGAVRHNTHGCCGVLECSGVHRHLPSGGLHYTGFAPVFAWKP